jgi:NADH dehydrogenase
MAITSQMIDARVMMSRAGPEAQRALAAFERAELAEQEAGG